NTIIGRDELLNINSADYLNLKNEKYLSSLSGSLNAQVNEREVVRIVLQELTWRSGSKTAYYIQFDETNYFISSLAGNNDNESSPVFTENTIPANTFFIDKQTLYDMGFSLLRKNNDKDHFFEKNKWIESSVETLLVFPVIVRNEIIGIIALDISGKESELSAAGLMIYQTVSSIITGSLKRVSYESDIRLKKEQFELIIENTPHHLFQLLPDGKIIFSNKKFSEFLNISHKELVGMSIYDILNSDGVTLLNNILYALTRENASGNAELLTTASGIPRLIKLDYNAVFNDQDKISFINFMGEDITEKKFLETELLKTKKRLDLAFLAANDSYWDADLITGEFFYSQNFYRMLGYDHYDKLDRFSQFLKLVHPDDITTLKDAVKKSLSGEVIRSTLKFRAKTSDNQYKWLLSRTMVIETNEYGKPSRIIGTNSDITETVRIENKLKESENRLKLILDNMPVMLDAMDSEGNIIHWNRECERVTGYAKEEIINNPHVPEFLCRDDEEIKCTYEKRMELGGNYRNEEFDLTCKDGKRKTIMWSNLSDLYPVPDWHTWSVGIDITELKEVTKALDLSREKLKEAQIIAKLGYWEYNHLNKTCTWDSILSEIMGYNKEFMELSESELFGFVHEDDRDLMMKKFIHHIKSRSPHDDIYRCRIKNGDIVHLKQISKTEYNSAGRAVISRGIVFDISELKKTELELLKAKEKAEENNRLKSAFLANMSHEIRTPLNSIIGFSELLSDNSSSPEDNIMYIDIIRESSKQLTSLISDIIDISKIDANLMDIEKKGLSLNKKIDHLYEIFKNEIKTRNKPIKLAAAAGLEPGNDFIVSDEIRLTQILSNLLANAVKFTENGFIEFGYTLTDNLKYIEFYVKDSGIGIQKKSQKKIFGRFQQAEPSIARRYGGTGLGLSISKELSRLLGGKMWLRSEPGEGSTFYFKIPYLKAEPYQIPAETAIEFDDEKYTKLKNKNILIVDDNTTVLKLLSAMLKNFGINCIAADSGQTAIKIIESGARIDLIFLDIQMPDMDGVTALNLIRNIIPSCKVIAQTANAFEEDREKYIQIGFNGYVSKPFNRIDIIKTISSLI
ncbi:MAG TPA: PAS domain S-box protein, partial [Spirochaetota bacterium]|nr:PAS domain S-box protein [Spirochaetota bacterium]HPS87292.1 PAS domain S-box protein [Spirochaetota bacterium]